MIASKEIPPLFQDGNKIVNSSSGLMAARLFGAGVVLFSGSLYGYVLTERRKLAMAAPVGGLAFIAGWIALATRK